MAVSLETANKVIKKMAKSVATQQAQAESQFNKILKLKPKPEPVYLSPGALLTSPLKLRQAFLANKLKAPKLPLSGWKIGQLVRLRTDSVGEFIVLDETPIEALMPGEQDTVIGLFGGRENKTAFRTVYAGQIKGQVTKPKTKFGKGLDAGA